MSKPVLKPGRHHPITVEPNPARIVVRVGDRIVADTTSARTLREASYPAVQYIPRSDVDESVLERTDHTTYCPYKGDASYFSIALGDQRLENAIWTYEAPHASVADIKDHLAFYPDKVQIS